MPLSCYGVRNCTHCHLPLTADYGIHNEVAWMNVGLLQTCLHSIYIKHCWMLNVTATHERNEPIFANPSILPTQCKRTSKCQPV